MGGPAQARQRWGLSPTASKEEFFMARVDQTAPGGCWFWLGNVGPHGYGTVKVYGIATRWAHRVAYLLFRGEIPEGLVIDHLCRVAHCVNPDHLEVVTRRVNTLRGEGPTARNADKAVCKRGHLLAEDNIVRRDGQRQCKACIRIRSQRRWQETLERRAAGAAPVGDR